MQSLLTSGILRLGEQVDDPEDSITTEYMLIVITMVFIQIFPSTSREKRERKVFTMLLHMVPNLRLRLTEGSDEDVAGIANLVRCPQLNYSYVLLLIPFSASTRSIEC